MSFPRIRRKHVLRQWLLWQNWGGHRGSRLGLVSTNLLRARIFGERKIGKESGRFLKLLMRVLAPFVTEADPCGLPCGSSTQNLEKPFGRKYMTNRPRRQARRSPASYKTSKRRFETRSLIRKWTYLIAAETHKRMIICAPANFITIVTTRRIPLLRCNISRKLSKPMLTAR